MDSPKPTIINDPEDDVSIFERPRIALLNEKHWFYVQKRYHLTYRELQVAQLICQGFCNGEIIKDLEITPGTVKTHLRNIYRKIRVKNKIEMLLKFVNDATKFSSRSGIAPPVPVVDVEKPDKKTSTIHQTPQ